MRLSTIMLPLRRATRLATSFSVRTRIVVLALVPVVGFLANGLTYLSSEGEIGAAFQTANQSAMLADASRDFKSAIATMRIAVKDYATNPSDAVALVFTDGQTSALLNLDVLQSATIGAQDQNVIQLRREVLGIGENFSNLVEAQRALGYNEDAGLRGRLRNASSAVERIINENMTWLADAEAKKLMMTLLIMRHHEVSYRLAQTELTRQLFLAAYKQFTDTFAQIDGTPAMKASLEQQVKTYADTFAQWIEGFDRVYPLRAVIDFDSQRMLPRTDQIIQAAYASTAAAAAGLTASQARTRLGIIAVGIAMVALGLGFSWLIGRSITRPLNGLADVMKRLAAGDTGARIPATQARDEIGEMARTVIVFRDTMIERERLAQTQTEASRAQEVRSDTISLTIDQFKQSVEGVLGKLRAASAKLELR